MLARFLPIQMSVSRLTSSAFGHRATAASSSSCCRAQWQQVRFFAGSADEKLPDGLQRGLAGSADIPVGGENLYRRVGGPGYPMLFDVKYDKPTWQPLWEDEHQVMPRDGFGVPAHIAPEVSTTIRHVYQVPPQFFPFLKKLGDDSPALRPFTDKLISGELTHQDYENMFYRFAKPVRIFRNQIPVPYRVPEEITREEEIAWEGAWLSYRQRVLADYNSHMYMREYVYGALIGIFLAYIWLDMHRQYRIDMKLFYLEAPEHKINWVKPRGDLV